LTVSLKEYKRLAEDLSTRNTLENSFIRASTRISNLKSELHDYLEKYPKIMQSELAGDVEKLQSNLDSPMAWTHDNELGKDLAKIKQKAKDLGLEAQNLLDIFEKLFGQHLSTMITMAALHKMQEAAQKIYQNVVDIDTAMTELRKVTNLTASEYESFMDRAADNATQLGISISDFINSTADWARLGYTEQEAEELARVSSLMKNVGDGIESASDASSYLISAMQGFGLAADQASEFLDVMNQIANTEPVTANDLGVIMQKSAAAMNAAGNTYQETMARAAAVNGVLQDNDISGTYLKTLSMYLRAAKTDAESAGIEIDGMANSVSELRSKLKSLTGVDIMSDAAGKNFKSTYQIMKELSQVWGNLSDVTQANVTELISGKRGGQATSALLNNFSVAEDAMKQAANATGSALAENAKYLDSIQGRLAQLDASFQSLSTHVLDSGIVKYTVSFLTTIVKITDNITKLSGALPPIAAAVSGILSIMQANGKLQNGAGKVNMPAYVRCV
jgi:TP901 family phage tail tape measure protein